jgi:peptidoglycan/LPS O-acetylase OafA/YrhL
MLVEVPIMKYRADIDGLRALAVLPVVLYHASIPGFGGGFVGVDIFFVISGYLICGMIDQDIRDGGFSLGDFYKRRILRILPALFAMFGVTGVLAYAYCLPVEFEDFSKSFAGAVASVSNVYFAKTAGYFDAPAEIKPLLHTWSLGVEEQFYFVAPLLMLLLYRFVPKHAKWLLALAAVLSFVAAILMTFRNTTFVFYLTPFRAWELALGALLAIKFIPRPATAWGRNITGGVGLALMIGAIVLGTPSVPLLLMTGLAAVGATMVIASSERSLSWVGRLLSVPPLVFVGLISYSLYLWHWPLMVFQRTDGFLIAGSSAIAKLVVIAASIAVAILSWRFVERPFRAMARESSKSGVFATASAAMASAFAACVMILVSDGAPFRFPDRVVAISSYLAYNSSGQFRTGKCFLDTNRQHLDQELCMKMDPGRPNYLLVGDSHAAHLWFGLQAAMPEVNVMQATVSMCRPAIPKLSALETRSCPRLMNFVFEEFLVTHKVDKVLLAASWKDEDLADLITVVDTLRTRGIEVAVLGPIVEYDLALPRLLADEIRRDDKSAAWARRTPGIRERDREMNALVTAHGAAYVSVYDAICRSDRCDEFVGANVPMQFDNGHLTEQGSVEVGRRLSAAFARKLAGAGNVTN